MAWGAGTAAEIPWGGGLTSGGFVGWKNEQGFDVCGSVGRFRLTR